MTFKRFVDVVQVLALATAAVFVVLLFALGKDDEPIAAGVPGADLYRANCASCHGSEGQGGIGPRLGDGAVVEAFPDVGDHVQVVTEGRGGMPAFGDTLSAEQIRSIVDYERDGL